MIVCVDVDYQTAITTTACVGFAAWTDAAPAFELVDRTALPAAPYEPGRFYERELPYLVAILARVADPIDAVVIDGYVWLAAMAPGLGARLREARGNREPVVGVAKTAYRGAEAVPVLRGASGNPLHVTAAGIDPTVAADHICAMHGPFRIPTLLKRCDSLARGASEYAVDRR
jgi:deoxyribonuclease V